MTRFDPDVHHRRSIRLRAYDYARPGLYFVTLCTRNRECLFGEVVDDEPFLNDAGFMAAQCWRWLTAQYPRVQMDDWVVMPNHLHGIVAITADCGEARGTAVGTQGGSRTAPTRLTTRSNLTTPKPLGRLIGAFKTVSTRRINDVRGTPGATVWQRNYYEHVIRDDRDLDRIRRYVANNPSSWPRDEENPLARPRRPGSPRRA